MSDRARPNLGDTTAATLEPTRLRFREAMAHLGAAANIVTTAGCGGRVGFSATAVCSVTDDPPTLLICLNRSASVYPAVLQNGVLCVNTLGAEHAPLARLFGGKTPQEERFAAASWTSLSTGSPVLADALVSFDCRIAGTVRRGSHDLVFGEVINISQAPSCCDGLIYFGREFHVVTKIAAPASGSAPADGAQAAS